MAAFGTAKTRRPERTILANAVAWIGSSLLWWGFDLPNLWGPPPTFGIVAFSIAGVLLILGKFRAAANVAKDDTD